MLLLFFLQMDSLSCTWEKLRETQDWKDCQRYSFVFIYLISKERKELFSFEDKSAPCLSVLKPKLKKLQLPIRRKEDTCKSQWKLQVKTSKPPEARENAGAQAIGVRIVSDWREFFWTTKQSRVKPT